MEEAKLTNLQRNKINYHLRNGSSLPAKEEEEPRTTRGGCLTARLRYDARRRSLDAIKLSGAYEIPDSVVGPFREPTDLAKKRLQATMSGIKGTPRTARRGKRQTGNLGANDEVVLDAHQQIQMCRWLKFKYYIHKNIFNISILLSVLDEIKDRAEWLDDMERLGQGKKPRTMIQSQIAEKLREIKRLEKIHYDTQHLEVQLSQLGM